MTVPSRLLIVSGIAAGVAALAFLALGPILGIRAVTVVGYTGPDAPQVRRSLEAIAKSGTALRGAEGVVEEYAGMIPSIRRVSVERTGMFSTRIAIDTRPAVAVVHGAGPPHAAAEDGTPLPGRAGLATINVRGATPAQQRQLLAVAGALSARVRPQVRALEVNGGIMRARLREGTPVRLGVPREGEAKGRALGSVLSHAGARARAATYIDVSVPQRVVLGPPRNSE